MKNRNLRLLCILPCGNKVFEPLPGGVGKHGVVLYTGLCGEGDRGAGCEHLRKLLAAVRTLPQKAQKAQKEVAR